MTYYTVGEMRSAGRRASQFDVGGAGGMLRKSARSGRFDIFLSHSLQDAETILGVKTTLEASGHSVYVDWIEDPQLDRSRVSASTARLLRQRMGQCESLIYATSTAASTSKWMPWELGYFDGLKGMETVAIMPLVQSQHDGFVGQEYLAIYPLVERLQSDGRLSPWVSRRPTPGVYEAKSLDQLVTGGSYFQKIS